MSSATPELAAHESPAPHVAVAALSEPDDLALFHRSLAQLCRAEVPLGKAFRVLDGELRRGSLRTAVRAMAQAVDAGTPLAEAYADQADAFPPLYRHLVEGGMACGDLPGTLEEIARHAARRADVAQRLRRALSYPIVTAVVVLIGGTALMAWAGPAFDEFIARLQESNPTAAFRGGPVSAPSTGFLGTGLPTATFALITLATMLLGTLWFTWVRSPLDGSGGVGGLGFRVPVFGRMRLYSALCGLCSTLGMLLRRGVPLPSALELTARATPSRYLRRRVELMAQTADEGAGLADSLAAANLLPSSLIWLVDGAQERGDAAGGVDDVAQIYARRLERSIERMEVLARPLAELAIGAVVFALAYGFIVPLVRTTGDILGLAKKLF